MFWYRYIYHDDSKTEDDHVSENINNSSGIKLYLDALRSIKYFEKKFLLQRNEKKIIINDLQCATEECLVKWKKKQTPITDFFSFWISKLCEIWGI